MPTMRRKGSSSTTRTLCAGTEYSGSDSGYRAAVRAGPQALFDLEIGRLHDRGPAGELVADQALRLLRPGVGRRLEAGREQDPLEVRVRPHRARPLRPPVDDRPRQARPRRPAAE